MFEVCAERCDQCLFSKNRIVSKERMVELINDCRKRDVHFICHKHTIANEGSQVMCRGYYETQPAPQILQIAERLNCVIFVKEPE